MQPATDFPYRAVPISNQQRRRRRGFTLIELLVASVILSVALMGLVSVWYTMLNSTLNTDDRGAAYEVGRLVLERARVNGFSINAPTTLSAPNGVADIWSSPNIATYRFFSTNLQELGYSNTNPTPLPGTRYMVTTLESGAGADNVPRADLQLLTLRVNVQLVYPDGTVDTTNLTDLETCLTEGGIQ